MDNNKYCLILAGGIGSRLWPVSRTVKPKQFMDPFGVGRSLLQQTYDRFASFIDPDHIYISTNVDYLPLVYEQLPQVDDAHILEEPLRRGTLASAAWGTVVIAQANPNADIVVTPADQLILQEARFSEDVTHALDFASRTDGLCVMGIRPTRPDTGYGYIQADTRVIEDDVYKVKTFTEKPERQFAEMFLAEGDFLWNTGIFFFHAETLLNNLYKLVPEYHLEIPRMKAEAEKADPKLVPEFFAVLPNLTIDLGILERSQHVYVHEGHFGWADLGTWANLYNDSPSDENGNVVLNTKSFLYDCQDNIIRLPRGRVAVVKGLKDYVVAEEGEILMICPKEDVSAMRKMHTDTKFS